MLTHIFTPRKRTVICGIFTAVWLSNLISTDSYFSVYALIALFSFWIQIKGQEQILPRKGGECIFTLLSLLFSSAVLLSNYSIFIPAATAHYNYNTAVLRSLVNVPLTFLGGICVAYPIIRYLFARFPGESHSLPAFFHACWLPWATYGFMLVINLVHLFLVEYPGTLTEDTISQIEEMVSGSYSNFNTFYHTMLFQGALSLGYRLFGDINAAAAFSCTLQCMILCAAFVYCLVTLWDYGVSLQCLIAAWALYTLIPYNIALSISIWKDVLFAASFLLILSSWLRIMKGLGFHPVRDYIIFCLGSMLFLLSRSVGWMLYPVIFISVLFFSRKRRKLLIITGIFAFAGWLLLNPVLSLLNIPPADKIESLNIPIQQVSRVIVEKCPLTEEEEELLSQIIDLEQVSSLYDNDISDPMKVALRQKNPEYFHSHMPELLSLWLKLGLRYPVQYIKAWVDMTRGYWNGGYFHFLWAEYVAENPYGIITTKMSNPIANLFRIYFNTTRHVIFFQPLYSIGLHMWLLFLCFFLNIFKKREEFILSIPLVVLVLGLLVSTPCFCLFRYVYPVFVSLPLILGVTVFERYPNRPEKRCGKTETGML